MLVVAEAGRRPLRPGAGPERERPDVVVADIHLPDGDGIEVADHIAACPAAKVVFLSSDGNFALVRRALDAGGMATC